MELNGGFRRICSKFCAFVCWLLKTTENTFLIRAQISQAQINASPADTSRLANLVRWTDDRRPTGENEITDSALNTPPPCSLRLLPVAVAVGVGAMQIRRTAAAAEMGPIAAIIIIICPSGDSSSETPAQKPQTHRFVVMRPTAASAAARAATFDSPSPSSSESKKAASSHLAVSRRRSSRDGQDDRDHRGPVLQR